MPRHLFYNLDHEPISPDEGSVLLSDTAACHIRLTAIDDEVVVSTIFLVVNHQFADPEGPPVLYETMALGGAFDGNEIQQRWTTREQAEAGHDQIVAEVRAVLGVPAN